MLVHRDEVVPAEEEVDVARLEALVLLPGFDAVQDQVQQLAVRLDLRQVHFRERVLDGQLVKVEDVPRAASLSGSPGDSRSTQTISVAPGASQRGSTDSAVCSRAVAVDKDEIMACGSLTRHSALGIRHSRCPGGLKSRVPCHAGSQSRAFCFSAACAAASRATGTRNGEQLT